MPYRNARHCCSLQKWQSSRSATSWTFRLSPSSESTSSAWPACLQKNTVLRTRSDNTRDRQALKHMIYCVTVAKSLENKRIWRPSHTKLSFLMQDASTLCRFVDSMLFYLVISAKSSALLSHPPSKNTSRTLAKTSLGKTLISVLDFGEERRTETCPNKEPRRSQTQ